MTRCSVSSWEILSSRDANTCTSNRFMISQRVRRREVVPSEGLCTMNSFPVHRQSIELDSVLSCAYASGGVKSIIAPKGTQFILENVYPALGACPERSRRVLGYDCAALRCSDSCRNLLKHRCLLEPNSRFH